MKIINRNKNKELELKIVYCGYGLSGRTTNIKYFYEISKLSNRMHLKYEHSEGTILRCKVALGEMNYGYKIILNLAAKVGNIYSPKDEFEVLEGVDGIIFVAHSHTELMHLNEWKIEELIENLKSYGSDIKEIPYALQCNKRDLENIFNINEIMEKIRVKDEPVFEAIANNGIGVFETLYSVVNQILVKRSNKLNS